MMQMMSYFRSKPVTPNANVDSKSNLASISGTPGNLFPKGTVFDFYVFIGESENFNDFGNENALYYQARDIEYGNWQLGENKDGVFVYSGNFQLTTV